jgi:hypothetical protein
MVKSPGQVQDRYSKVKKHVKGVQEGNENVMKMIRRQEKEEKVAASKGYQEEDVEIRK